MERSERFHGQSQSQHAKIVQRDLTLQMWVQKVVNYVRKDIIKIKKVPTIVLLVHQEPMETKQEQRARLIASNVPKVLLLISQTNLLVGLVHKELIRMRLVEPSAKAVRQEHLELQLEQSRQTTAKSVQKELHSVSTGADLVLFVKMDFIKMKLGKPIARSVRRARPRLDVERRTSRSAAKFSYKSVFFFMIGALCTRTFSHEKVLEKLVRVGRFYLAILGARNFYAENASFFQ